MANENTPADQTPPTNATVETTEATEKQAAEVWAEFLKTGRVRAGYAVSASWPEKARKIVKD